MNKAVRATGVLRRGVLLAAAVAGMHESIGLAAQTAVSVGVNANSVLAPVSDMGLGLHTSVYANQFANPQLIPDLAASGVQSLRYPGGSYSDLYTWTTNTAINGGYTAPAATFSNFVKIMEGTSTQGMVTVNYGSSPKGTTGGQPQEAAAWVAYANSNASLFGTPQDVNLGTDAEGNNWYTAGYWAKLRSSTVSQYRTWAKAAGDYNSAYEFLCINQATPVGIKYWEIGNEIGGNGYTGTQWEEDLHAPYANGDPTSNTGRQGNAALSPTAYATNLLSFASLMKQVDPTIKIGAGLDGSDTAANHAILSTAGNAIDFGIVHWYPTATTTNALLKVPAQQLASIASSIATDFSTYAHKAPGSYELHITEFGFDQNTLPQASYEAALIADSYATGEERGIKSMDYLEMSKSPFLGDSSTLAPGDAYYAMQMVSKLVEGGQSFLTTTSSDNTLRVHAVKQADGSLALMLINEDPGNGVGDDLVTVNLAGMGLGNTGLYAEYGFANVAGNFGLTTQTLTGVGNQFTIDVPDMSIVTVIIAAVPEPSAAALLALAVCLPCVRRRRLSN